MSSLHEYENLCGLNCLDIEEKHEKKNEFINERLSDLRILRIP